MSEERNEGETTEQGEATEQGEQREGGGRPVFAVDWKHEPPALYVNAAEIDFAPDVVSLVFLDASPLQRRVKDVDGTPHIRVEPVVSLRMTHANFLYVVRELARRWDEFAAESEAAGRKLPRITPRTEKPSK